MFEVREKKYFSVLSGQLHPTKPGSRDGNGEPVPFEKTVPNSPSELLCLRAINSLYRCWHVFMTAVQCKKDFKIMRLRRWKFATSRVTVRRKKRSKLWLPFTNKHDNCATGNVFKMISSNGENTSNMLKNLSTHHGFKFLY